MAVVTQNQFSLLGELFQVGKRPNTVLRLLGGIQGGMRTTTSKEYPTGVYYSLRAPGQANLALEGANAPAAQNRTLSQSTNNIQIAQETVSVTYLAESDQTVGGVVPIPQGDVNRPVQNPRSLDFQIKTALDTVAQDYNWSLINGAGVNPADPSGTVLKTRGLLPSIVTNTADHSADTNVTPAMYRGYINQMLATMIASNGYMIDDNFTILAGVVEYANIAAAFTNQGQIYLTPETQVFGVKVRNILTTFGSLQLALDPDMPAQTIAISDLGDSGLVGMPVRDKGIVFAEALAHVGSAETWEVYGQMGADFGPEFLHGKIKVAAGLSL